MPRTAQAVLDRGADYLLALKANQGHLFEEAELYFQDATPALDRHQTVDADHGRIETRRHAVSRDVAWLRADRAAPGEPRFPGLKAIAMVEAEVETGGRTTRAQRYYLSSAPLDAQTFARAVRAHWGVENRLHWVLDVVFHDASPASGPVTGPRIWPSSNTWPSTCSTRPPGPTASKHDENAPDGTTTTSRPSSLKPHDALQAIPLGEGARD